jgi:hypothetical protein
MKKNKGEKMRPDTEWMLWNDLLNGDVKKVEVFFSRDEIESAFFSLIKKTKQNYYDWKMGKK